VVAVAAVNTHDRRAPMQIMTLKMVMPELEVILELEVPVVMGVVKVFIQAVVRGGSAMVQTHQIMDTVQVSDFQLMVEVVVLIALVCTVVSVAVVALM
jgi:hypothetical protein